MSPYEWRDGGWQRSRKVSKAERWLIRSVILLAIVTIFPVRGMVTGLIERLKQAKVPYVPTYEEKVLLGKTCSDILRKALTDQNYTPREYIQDSHVLVPLFEKLNVWGDYHQKIADLCDHSRKCYLKKYRNDPVTAEWRWQSEWNQAYQELGNPCGGPLVNSGQLKRFGISLLIWYLTFIPYAFLILLIRLWFNPGYQFKQELLLCPHKPLMAALFWPFGLGFYPDGPAAIHYRYRKLESLYRAAKGYKWDERLSSEEEEMLRHKANKRIEDFDRLVSELAVVPVEKVKEQSKAMAFAMLMLSIILAPLASAKIFNRSKDEIRIELVACKVLSGELYFYPYNGKLGFCFDHIGLIDIQPDTGHELVAVLPEIYLISFFVLWFINYPYFSRPPPQPVFRIDHVPRISKISHREVRR